MLAFVEALWLLGSVPDKEAEVMSPAEVTKRGYGAELVGRWSYIHHTMLLSTSSDELTVVRSSHINSQIIFHFRATTKVLCIWRQEKQRKLIRVFQSVVWYAFHCKTSLRGTWMNIQIFVISFSYSCCDSEGKRIRVGVLGQQRGRKVESRTVEREAWELRRC